MSDQTCVKFGPAAHRTVAVAIELVGWTLAHSHSVLEKVLADPKIQAKLAEELKKAGEKLMAEQNSGQPPRLDKSLSTVAAAAQGVVLDPAKAEVKRSDEFKRLESSFDKLRCAIEHAPVGAFVNENKTLLVVVGSVAAIGGGVAMYTTKTGDGPAKALSLLPMLVPEKIGSVNVSLQNFEFKPSERKVALDAELGGKWSAVEAKLNLGATFAHDSLTRAAGSGKLTLYLNSDWQASAGGSFSWTRDRGNARNALNGAAEVGVRRKLSPASDVSIQLFGNYVNDEKSLSRQAGIRGDYVVGKMMGPDSRLTLSPSYSMKQTQARDQFGIGAPRTDHRVFINLKLEFNLP